MLASRWFGGLVSGLGIVVILGLSVLAAPATLRVTSYSDVIRFEAQGSVTELRVEILSLAGQKIVDSGIIRGAALDWRLGDQQGHLVASGVYLYAVTVKDASGKLSKHLGKLTIMRGKIGSNQAPGLSLPTVGILAGCYIDCEPPTPRWQEFLDTAGADNFRLVRLGATLLTLDNVGRLSVPQLCLNGDCRTLWPAGGTVTSITAGAGLTGGTITTVGTIALATPTASTLGGVKSSTCSSTNKVTGIDTTGALTCAADVDTNSGGTVTSVSTGFGLNGGPITITGTISVDTAVIQARVSGTCGSGTAIRVIDAAGGVTCETIPGTFSGWALAGNSGTSTGTNFIGTTDNVALEFKVNSARVLRLEPNATSPNLIGGYSGNSVTGGMVGATISGGGTSGLINQVTAIYGTVGGGVNNTAGGTAAVVGGGNTNTASNFYATVGGGFNNTASNFYTTIGGGTSNTASGEASTVGGGNTNTASNFYATVGGGQNNTASDYRATVGGGFHNTASNSNATVGGGISNTASGSVATVGGGSGNTASLGAATVSGGQNNTASGYFATVGGGDSNTAAGDYSFVIGRQAKNTDASHDGVFLFADSTTADFSSTAANQFRARVTGGAEFITNSGESTGVTLSAGGGSWSSVSDRNVKENFKVLDKRGILAKLAQIPITGWNYKTQEAAIRHLGPMAQDFYAAFGLGEDDKHINTIDADGIALISIQALYAMSLEKDKQIEQLTHEVQGLKQQLQKLQQAVEALSKK
jgi:hypothetical protein